MAPADCKIESLHEDLFGFVPVKDGAAYERLAAVVLAALGWQNLQHDTIQTRPERQAVHQIDVIADDPEGEHHRVLIECKHWNANVGKGVVDGVVGVRHQLGADAAIVVTTVGFTAGALRVAADEGVDLVRLQAYDPDPASDQTRFVERIVLRIDAYASSYSALGVELMDPDSAPRGEFQCRISTETGLLAPDGEPAECLADILQSNSAGMTVGTFDHRVAFDDGRILRAEGLPDLSVSALTWTETVSCSEHLSVTEMKGTPAVVIEEIRLDREPVGRLVVSEDLYAWDIDSEGTVVPRGQLTTGSDV